MEHQAPERRGNNVLVVDDFALSIVNAAVSQSELLKAGFMSACCGGARARGRADRGCRRASASACCTATGGAPCCA
jgi:hypothetical protein